MANELKYLFDRLNGIVESSRNKKNENFWYSKISWPRNNWRGFPKVKPSEGVPFLVFCDNALWAKKFNVDLQDYYSNPIVHLKTQLKENIYHFDHWADSTYYTRDLFIWFGVVTELSFFEPKIRFFPDRDGWIEHPPLLERKEKLAFLPQPDFYKGGLMPKIHEFYEKMSELTDERFRVLFPKWVRGPFCIAAHLRGFDNIIIDMLEDPEFVHKLMRFVVDSEKKWAKERAKFLNSPLEKTFFFNDEIGLPFIKPDMYEEFILPYEIELANFYGGVLYWHSCGDTTQFVELIRKIPGLKMFHVGPNTDLQKAVQVFAPDVSLDVDLDPFRDVLQADEELMKSKIERIIAICSEKDVPFCIRADAFQPVYELEKIFSKIQLWIEIIKSAIGKGFRKVKEDESYY